MSKQKPPSPPPSRQLNEESNSRPTRPRPTPAGFRAMYLTMVFIVF